MQVSTTFNLKSNSSKKITQTDFEETKFKTFKGYCKQYNMIFFGTTTEMTYISEMWKHIQSEMAIDLPILTTYNDMLIYLNKKNASASIKTGFRYQYFLGKFGKYQVMFQYFLCKYKHNIFCVKRFMNSLNVRTMETFKLRLDHILKFCNQKSHDEQEHEDWLILARYMIHFIEDEMQRDPTMQNPLLFS
jgi:hypothetical protein